MQSSDDTGDAKVKLEGLGRRRLMGHAVRSPRRIQAAHTREALRMAATAER